MTDLTNMSLSELFNMADDIMDKEVYLEADDLSVENHADVDEVADTFILDDSVEAFESYFEEVEEEFDWSYDDGADLEELPEIDDLDGTLLVAN